MGAYNFIIPLGYVLLSEITPSKNCQMVLNLIGIFYSLGAILSCLIAKIFLNKDLVDG